VRLSNRAGPSPDILIQGKIDMTSNVVAIASPKTEVTKVAQTGSSKQKAARTVFLTTLQEELTRLRKVNCESTAGKSEAYEKRVEINNRGIDEMNRLIASELLETSSSKKVIIEKLRAIAWEIGGDTDLRSALVCARLFSANHKN
jgi:hypothetical protein